jgi:hypothetical protein
VGPHGTTTFATGPRGQVLVARNSFTGGGRTFVRPAFDAHRMAAVQHSFVGVAGFTPFFSFGLVAPLWSYPSLSFLSTGILIGSYPYEDETVYVYVVNEDGQDVQYLVDSNGNVLSAQYLD